MTTVWRDTKPSDEGENAARGLVIGLAISLALWLAMAVVFILLAVIL